MHGNLATYPKTANPLTIEWASFTTAQEIDETAVLRASDTVQKDFLDHQRGFVRRELLQGENNQWLNIIYWNTIEDAEEAVRNASEDPACRQFFALMLTEKPCPPNVEVLHFRQVKTYKK